MAAPWREFRLGVPDQYGIMRSYTFAVPTEWTLLTEVRDALQAGVQKHDELCEYGMEFGTWACLLLFLWEKDTVELSARWSNPNAEHRIIDYPISERVFGYYGHLNNRLLHRAKQQFFYDVKMRAKPVPRAAAPVPEAGEETDDGLSARQRRDQLVFDAWHRAGFPETWTAKIAFARAEKHPVLQVGETEQFECWKRVRERPRNSEG
jgi:hypothetical protein